MSDDYEESYRTPDWFGSEPEPLLSRFADRLPAGATVLDIGAGQGRHTLPLARRGCRVTALDTSAAAVEQIRVAAADAGLVCTVRREDVFAFAPAEPFDAVLCFGLIQMVPVERVAALTERLREWVRPGGALWLTAWHTGDPACGALTDPWRPTGPRSWHDPVGDRHRFFLHPDEILDLFPGWEVLHHEEVLGPWHRHGDGPEQRHGVVEAVLARPEHHLVDVWTRLGG